MPGHSRKSKTSRFPVARIKKIMQTDEEVGKLASATPVMISKSLECFMQHLIEETCKETRARGSKKLTAYHLKQTIMTRPTLDFLLPITANIPDPAPTDEKPPKPSTSTATRRNTSGNASSGAAEGSSRKRAKQEPEYGYDAPGYGQEYGHGHGSAHEHGHYGQHHASAPVYTQEIGMGQPYHLPHLHQPPYDHHSQHSQHPQYAHPSHHSHHPNHSAPHYSPQHQYEPSHSAHAGSSGHAAQGGQGSVNPQILPNIDTWKRDATGGGGTGEGGRGMFDDYEEDDEDY